MPVVVLVVVVGLCFVPIPWRIPALRSAHHARAFIAQIWAVEAAAVGFSVAVVVFAFQAVAAARRSISVRELASVTPMLAVVYVGISGLLVDGFVLLGLGKHAPAGWPGTWAAVVSFTAMGLIAPLFAMSVRAIDEQQWHRRRIANVQAAVEVATAQDAQLRLMFNILRVESEAYHYGFHPLGLPNADGDAITVSPSREAYVVNVRLDRLRRLGTAAVRVGASPPAVVTYPTALAAPRRPMIILDGATPAGQRRLAARVMRTSTRVSRSSDALVEAANRLHEEALEAILNDRPALYDAAREAQQELLLSFPRAWNRLGQVFDEGLATGVLPLSMGPLDLIERHMFQQADRAIQSGHRDVAHRAAAAPASVAYAAVSLQAPGLVGRMLRLVSSLSALTTKAPPDSLAALIHADALDSLFAHVDYAVAPRVEDAALPGPEREAAIDLLFDAHDVIAGLMRSYINTGEWTLLREALKKWRQVMEFWLGDHEYDLPETPTLDGAFAQRIIARRRQLLFAVAAWLVRRMWQTDSTTEEAELLVALTSEIDQPDAVLDVVDRESETVADRRLSDWIMRDLPSGEVHVIDSTSWILRTSALWLVRLSAAAGVTIAPRQWLIDRQEGLETAIAELEQRPDLCRAVGITDGASALSQLRSSLTEALDQQRAVNEVQLIAAPIREDRIAALRVAAEEGWRRGRTMINLLDMVGGYHVKDEPAPTDIRLAQPPQLWPKDLFTSDRIFGLDGIGHRVGHSIARGENETFYRALREAKPLARTAGSADDRIRSGLERMTDLGYRPSFILIPFNWRLRMAISLEHKEPDANDQQIDRALIGQFAEVPVVQVHDLPKDRLFLVDLARFASATQWTAADASTGPRPGLQIRVQAYDDDSALAAVREQRNLMRQPGRTRQRDRARALLTVVRVDVGEAIDIDILDEGAARSVMLPPSLASR